jgi:hypothetical protein
MSLSRRAGIGAVLGAALGYAGASPLLVRAAKPVPATPEAGPTGFLFLQGFQSAQIEPLQDRGHLVVTLVQHAGLTVYFSERPARIVGVVDTAAFVEGFRAETRNDPANAALVAQIDQSTFVTHVVELLDMAYDPGAATATYTLRLLDLTEVDRASILTDPEQSLTEPRSYGATQLFIDAGGLMQLVAYGAQDVYLAE